MNWSRISRVRLRFRGVLHTAVGPLALGALLATALSWVSCRDDILRPHDTSPPARVTDLLVSWVADTRVELTFTNVGDDGMERTASRVEVRALPGGPILTDSAWAAAVLPATPPGTPGGAGTTMGVRFDGLDPESLYGFAVRIYDEEGNASPLSNSPTITTKALVAEDAGWARIILRSREPRAYLGTQILWNDRLLVAGAMDSVYELDLPEGVQTLHIVKACSILSPSRPQTVEIVRDRTSLPLVWQVDPIGAIIVVTSPPGAEIFVDDVSTGRQTPDTLRCLPPGSHTVRCALVGLRSIGDSVSTVTVNDQPQDVTFSLEPRPQARGVVLELFTATLCPNCPYADGALDSLAKRADLVERGYVGLQIHCSWGNSDPFYHPEGTGARISYYNSSSGIPLAWFNGGDRTQGAPSPPSSAERAGVYAAKIQAIQNDTEHPSRVALYWLSAERSAGPRLNGVIRVMLLENLEAADSTKLWVLDYKDRLVNDVPNQPHDTFGNVVREYKYYGNLTRDLHLLRRGDFADVAIDFDLSWDSRWSDLRLGMVALVQAPATRRIDQMAHKPLY